MSLTLFSPAKINLFLRILRRRPDGYHDLASLFQAIDFGDTLTIRLSKTDLLTCSSISIPCDPSNLILKAASAFRAKTALHFGVTVHLDKKVPLQAGLGGGSSNAATTLWGLNELTGRPLSTKELMAVGADVGADVPFFFSTGSAYCTGRGECVENRAEPKLPPITLVKPPFGLSTPLIFKNLDLKQCSPIDPAVMLEHFNQGNFYFYNDLEKTAFHIAPELKAIKEKLIAQGFSTVLMTGSGTTLVCFGEGNVPPMAAVEITKASALSRSLEHWYTP